MIRLCATIDLRHGFSSLSATSLPQLLQDGLDYDFALSSWVGDYSDPNTFVDCSVSGGGNNRTGWSNAEYDKLVATLQSNRRT